MKYPDRSTQPIARNAYPNAPVDLELLDTYLMSDDAPENCMGISVLDGLLTRLAIGPEQIMLSEWLPLIWGGDEPEFTTPDEANAVIGAVMVRYNEIITHLDTAPDSFDPAFLEGE